MSRQIPVLFQPKVVLEKPKKPKKKQMFEKKSEPKKAALLRTV